ncbi:unnamed protein product [Spirodela intermedia]|uniref:SET domain-containing protein n=1 Tax=Spirodela intermedia TaxID=51605 RepID=A0A7I8KC51_SPIIN|nr:unnamed protein product [Spirodela intermedia]
MASVAGALRRWALRRARSGATRSNLPWSFLSTSTTGAGNDAVSEQIGQGASGGEKAKTSAGSIPPPIRVSLTDSAGRGVFASRAIGAGDLIHTASPVVAHPLPSLLSKVCYYCLRRSSGDTSVLSDSSCSSARYFCSDECKEKSKGFLEIESTSSWSAYDTHCKERGLKYPFLVKRLACMVVAGTVSADTLDILQPASLHPDMLPEMEAEYELLKLAFVKADPEEALISFLTKQWFLGVMARIRINAFRVETVGGSYEDLLDLASSSVVADSAVGNAVYILPSFYNHDCDPNAHILWIDNMDAKLKVLRDIEPGEELRICYIDASMDWEARQSLLYHGFGFQCRCSRCLSGD